MLGILKMIDASNFIPVPSLHIFHKIDHSEDRKSSENSNNKVMLHDFLT
jgi:hypothetical protein